MSKAFRSAAPTFSEDMVVMSAKPSRCMASGSTRDMVTRYTTAVSAVHSPPRSSKMPFMCCGAPSVGSGGGYQGGAACLRANLRRTFTTSPPACAYHSGAGCFMLMRRRARGIKKAMCLVVLRLGNGWPRADLKWLHEHPCCAWCVCECCACRSLASWFLVATAECPAIWPRWVSGNLEWEGGGWVGSGVCACMGWDGERWWLWSARLG